jgi:hemolysin III
LELRDPISSASHLLTAVWATYATLILLRLAPPGRRIVAGIFGLSMILLYLASGTFHGVPFNRVDNPTEYRFFQRIDQTAIYLLIAGTNTPCLAILLGGRRAAWFLGLMWSLAAIGIAFLWLAPKVPHSVMISIYLSMGWLGIVPVWQYYRVLGWRALNWLWLGAFFYTVGAICELAEWPVITTDPLRFGPHEVLHVCDTAGSVAFFLFITRTVLHFQPRRRDPEPLSRAA